MVDLQMKEIRGFDYDRPVIEKGYANQTLYVNLATRDIAIKPLAEKMKEVFAK